MRIIVHAGFLSGQYLTGAGHFMHELVLEMATRNSSHTFIYLARAPVRTGPLPGNVTVHHVTGMLATQAGEYVWRRFGLPAAVKKLKADLVLALNEISLHSGGVPCCVLVLNPPDAATQRKRRPFAGARKRLLPASHLLLTVSEHNRQLLLRDYAVPPEKLKLLQLPEAGSARVLSYDEKEKVREQFTDGPEYFLFAGDIDERHDLLELLKAFAQFKKWQQSNMKLLIAGSRTGWTEQLLQKTASFKYRADVHILPDPSKDDLHALIGAAYAFVYPGLEDHFPLHVLHAMQAGVPVIASETGTIKALADNAVLYAAAGNAEGFAAHMRLLFKDEALRANVITLANGHLAQQGQHDVAGACWLAMVQMLEQ